MTCWPGVRLWESTSPLRRSRTASRNARTTPSSTSASSRAERTSARAASRSASLSRPFERRLELRRSRRSLRASNMKKRLASGAQKRIDERVGIEHDQVIDTLAHAHELDRYSQFALDGDHDAAARGAVEFREDDPGDCRGREELTRL